MELQGARSVANNKICDADAKRGRHHQRYRNLWIATPSKRFHSLGHTISTIGTIGTIGTIARLLRTTAYKHRQAANCRIPVHIYTDVPPISDVSAAELITTYPFLQELAYSQ